MRAVNVDCPRDKKAHRSSNLLLCIYNIIKARKINYSLVLHRVCCHSAKNNVQIISISIYRPEKENGELRLQACLSVILHNHCVFFCF